MGPRTEPCGTPLRTLTLSDRVEPTWTCCVLSLRKDANQLSSLSDTKATACQSVLSYFWDTLYIVQVAVVVVFVGVVLHCTLQQFSNIAIFAKKSWNGLQNSDIEHDMDRYRSDGEWKVKSTGEWWITCGWCKGWWIGCWMTECASRKRIHFWSGNPIYGFRNGTVKKRHDREREPSKKQNACYSTILAPPLLGNQNVSDKILQRKSWKSC